MSNKYKNLKLQGSLMIIAEGAKYWEPEETIDEFKQLLGEHITLGCSEHGFRDEIRVSDQLQEFLDD